MFQDTREALEGKRTFQALDFERQASHQCQCMQNGTATQDGLDTQDDQGYKPDDDPRHPQPAGSSFVDEAHSPDCDCSQHSQHGSAALAFMSIGSPQNTALACNAACMRSDSSAGDETHILDCSDHSALVPLETSDVLRWAAGKQAMYAQLSHGLQVVNDVPSRPELSCLTYIMSLREHDDVHATQTAGLA